jgi:MoaA/NifB/PqqE/SkfB family radical SAM enzyme
MREREEIRSDRTPAAKKARAHQVRLGKSGELLLPRSLLRTLGAAGKDRLEIVANRDSIEIRPSLHTLARVYIEPTSRCNLACRTCIRNTWDETLGDMTRPTFDRLASQLGRFPRLESVMFGGFGEPTAHPDILAMIGKVKALGVRAEMTTNGTLLDERLIEGLLQNRLDRLWVSFDGPDESGFETIRKGARFQGVVASLELLRKKSTPRRKIDVGIAYVVMKSNIDGLKAVDELARRIGADRILVSNVLPYSPNMEKEMLCQLTLTTDTFTSAPGKIEMSLPRLDVSPFTREALFSLLQGFQNLSLMESKIRVPSQRCRFVRDRTTFVRWDGRVSPCMGLLHPYTTYLYGNARKVRSHAFGDIRRSTLQKIWNSREYRAFRERVRDFEFSPCHICGGCTLVESNEEDCFGNAFPVCGACLWAQGVIQCP